MAGTFSVDTPVFSRLFVVNVGGIPKETLESVFGRFGTVESVKKLQKKDDSGSENDKGIAYVKYSKTSEAANAIDHESEISSSINSNKPIVIKLALSRNQGKGEVDMELTRKVFISCPKDFEQDDVLKQFQQFGQIEKVKIVRDRQTGNHRGIAFIFFNSFSGAANAVENAPSSFRAVFSKPLDARKRMGGSDDFPGNHFTPQAPPYVYNSAPNEFHRSMDYSNEYQSGSYPFTDTYRENLKRAHYDGGDRSGCTLQVAIHQHSPLTQVQRLFGICPGLVSCDFSTIGGQRMAIITYDNPQSAAHVKNTVEGLEFPPGYFLAARYYSTDNRESASLLQSLGNSLNSGNPEVKDLLQQLLKKVAN